METEEAVLDVEIGSRTRVTGFEHRGDPRVANATIANHAEVVDHPINGFAGFASAEFKTLCCAVHLFWGETIFRNHLVTEVGIIGATLFYHGAPW